MATASFPLQNMMAPLQSLAAWLFAKPVREAARAPMPRAVRPPVAAASVARPTTRPLRVVRVFEGPRVPASAGRMVISGRMADVCAELDRLAAMEASSARR